MAAGAAAGAPGGWRALFEEAAGELNYGRRCSALSRLGKRLASEVPHDQLAEGLTGLASDTFSALGALTVAQKAGCPSVAKSLLSHHSQAVRSRAAALLQASDAEEAFLSEDSNQQLKTWLVRGCPALPCSPAVLEHAHRMFPAEIVWLVLQRTTDEAIFKEWVERLSTLWPASGLPGMVGLTFAFPNSILEMTRAGKFATISWDWLLVLARRRPFHLLEFALLEKGGECLAEHLPRLVAWSWRHQHDILLDLCLTKLCAGHSKAGRPRQSAFDLVKMQQSIVSSHACPTVIRKIETIVAVFSALPEQEKGMDTAKRYIELLPLGIEAHRSNELEKLVGAYWRVMDELGRSKLEQATNGGHFAAFVRRLPPPLAVEQLFRVLRDVEPDDKVYLFVQSDLCQTADGRHDALMQQVFERFLKSQRRDRTESNYVQAFQALLKTAVSMDVIQASFEALTTRLRGATERSLFRDVVKRMKELDALITAAKEAEPDQKPVPPAPSLPLPASWLRFLPYPEKAPPHVAFLYGALASWAADADALNQAVARFGTALFWSTLENVLEHALGKAKSVQWKAEKVDFAALANLSAIAPVPRATPSEEATATSEQHSTASSVYFAQLEKKKQETFNKDANKRLAGYARLVSEAKQETDVRSALADLLPFLATRLGGEQENVQFQVWGDLLPAFSAADWAEHLEDLRALWKVYSKARGQGSKHAWVPLGQNLVRHELENWQSGQEEPSAVCAFGVEVSLGNLSFADEFEWLHRAKGKDLREEAARWLLRAAVPLPAESRALLAGEDAARCNLKGFCSMLERMALAAAPAPGLAERTLWERWPWVGEWWEALLERGLSLSGAEFLLAGVIEHWAERQQQVVGPENKQGRTELWWQPLECRAYKSAVERVLLQIETGEIPCIDGARMIAQRSEKVQVMEDMMSRGSASARDIRTYFGTTYFKRPWFQWPEPEIDNARPDSSLKRELAVLSQLLDTPNCPRQVQWSALFATAGLRGDAAGGVLRKVVGALDARKEGMARCVAQQYPYVNAALAADEDSKGNCDLLSAALEVWLHDTGTRDKRVAELMARPDAECLLFFGNNFAEHLSRCRQEWLHQCLLKIKAPPEDMDAGPAEFYHHTSRIPSLARVAQLTKGWRSGCEPHNPSRTDSHSNISTFFWHPSTQTEFLSKGLTSTDMSTLAIIPSLEYVDGVGRAGELLKDHPREQQRQQGDAKTTAWTIIQQTGFYEDVWAEVEKRFAELGMPVAKDSIGDREADQILINLGRADHADNALKILGRYGSKFKRAKEALIQAVPNLSPSHARRVIEEVCLGKDAGVSLQVAALRLIMDLQVPRPLQLYRVAWRDGICHRDIAANILTKVATSPVSDWAPEDVRDMFDIFVETPAQKTSTAAEGMPVPAGKKYPEGTYQAMSAARKDNLSYIAKILLEALAQMPKWTLPFLPEVVGRLALLPECTDYAVAALRANTGQATEVVGALTEVMRQARLADMTVSEAPKKRRKGAEPLPQLSQMLSQLSAYAPGNGKSLSRHVKAMDLATCQPAALRAFVDELLLAHSSAPAAVQPALPDAVSIWAQALRKEAVGGSWESLLREMEDEVVAHGGVEQLGMLAGKVFEHVEHLGLARKTEGPQLLPLLQRFLQRILKRLEPSEREAGRQADELVAVRNSIVLDHWAKLVAQGSGPDDVKDFLQRCPQEKEVELASRVVEFAKSGLWWRADQQEKSADIAAAEVVARSVLVWLEETMAEGCMEALARLWPRVLESDQDGQALEVALAIFARHSSSYHGMVFVNKLVESSTAQRHLTLRALRWLAESRPRDVVRLWPEALSQGAGKQKSSSETCADVRELLGLCEAKGLEPPELPRDACRSKAVVAVLAASPLPRARLSAVRALRERDLREKDKDQADLLSGLQADSCVVVSVAARLAWTSIFGEEEEEKTSA